jgi:hypothetical protein
VWWYRPRRTPGRERGGPPLDGSHARGGGGPPKLKAVEHAGDVVARLLVVMGAQPDATSAEWERRNNPDGKGKLQ